MKNELRSVCPHDCPDTCGIIPYVKDGKLVKVKGDLVRVLNERGEFRVWASVGENVKEGVAVNKGIWWNSLSPGGCNSNQTTPDRLADMGGGSTYNTNLVQIERVNDDKI